MVEGYVIPDCFAMRSHTISSRPAALSFRQPSHDLRSATSFWRKPRSAGQTQQRPLEGTGVVEILTFISELSVQLAMGDHFCYAKKKAQPKPGLISGCYSTFLY